MTRMVRGALLYERYVRTVLSLYTHDAQTVDPAGWRETSVAQLYRTTKRTHVSALSKLSLNTPVTLRIISRLSVASVRMRWAASVAEPAVGRDAVACLCGPDGTKPAVCGDAELLRVCGLSKGEDGAVLAAEPGRESVPARRRLPDTPG